MKRSLVGSACVAAVIGVVIVAAWPATAGPANPSAAKAPTTSAATTGAGTYVSLDPSRLLDSRTGLGGATPGARGTVHLEVTGHGGVPSSGVSAVVLTVTAVAPASSGFVTAYADGSSRPAASNLNFVKGRTVPNLVIAPVNTSTGKIALYNGSIGATPLLADVSGYFVAGTPTLAGSFRSLTPARILDTRTGNGGSTPKTHGTVPVQITGKGGIPSSGVSAVILNVTAVSPSGGGYVTVYGSGQSRPTTSNLNFARGQTVPNVVVAAVGTGGKVSIYNGGVGSTPLIADVAGYFKSGTAFMPGTFTPVTPQRALDTRHNVGASRPGPRAVAIVGPQGFVRPRPFESFGADVSALVMNVTVPNAAADGHITVGRGADDGSFRPPNVSNLNFSHGQTVSNLTFAPMNRHNDVFLYNGSTGSNDLLGDVAGYYISDTGSISGTVTDSSTGAPIAGVKVTADGEENGFGGSTTTDADGHYEFDALAPLFDYYGSYRLCFSHDDDATAASAGGYLPDCLQSSVEVYNGETTTGVNKTLTPGVAISGQVNAGSETPSQIHFFAVAIFDSTGKRVTAANVASNGQYRVASVPAGTYTACSLGAYVTDDPQVEYGAQCFNGKSWDGNGNPPTGTTPVAVSAGNAETGVNFNLELSN